MKLTQEGLSVAQRAVVVFLRLISNTKITATHSEKTVDEQANHWFVRRRNLVVRCQEDEKFRRWLDADEENRAHYHQLEELWGFIAVYTNKPEIRSACEKACQRLQL